MRERGTALSPALHPRTTTFAFAFGCFLPEGLYEAGTNRGPLPFVSHPGHRLAYLPHRPPAGVHASSCVSKTPFAHRSDAFS